MLIEEIIEIKEFRGIKELAEPLLLRKFNVLIGKNNSGKSALLEALFLFPHPERMHPLRKQEITNKKSKKPNREHYVLFNLAIRRHGLSSLIYKYSGTATIILRCSEGKKWEISINESGSSKVKLNGRYLTLDSKTDLLYYQSETKKKINIMLSQHPDIPLSSSKRLMTKISTISLYFPYDTDFIRSIDEYLTKNENSLMKYGIHSRIAQLVSQELDEKFTEIVLKKDGWYLRREDATYIHIDDVGDGLKKAARIMMVAELLKPKLILWDDFDTSLHPSMIKMLLKWLAQGDWQVVIATHSIDVLYYLADLNEELDDFDAQLILLRKDQEDILHHKELNMDELEDLLEGNVDPRMLVDVLKI
ncbi:AAA family ATPase [Thermococcus paralvinellae]|uniref:ATPase AAA-type core domain-containing protein n=1 Tax=Thermococcus paralvinellae TaxID=582419 RepID=W0I6G5_9EURY|nr:ATP-binding protein [Thermococcus paralvinellae]AHF80332.1 Hypothetical protein TES1_0948 [Thermococcus paralvinellae]